MLDLSVIGVALNWWFIGSYRTGEFIVYTGISCVELILNAIKNFNSFIILLYEGSSLWVRDVHDYLLAVQELIHNGSDHLTKTANSLTEIVAQAVFYAPLSILAASLTSLREILALLGSSCLFLLSLPPLFLFYSIDTLLNLFATVCFVARHVAQRATEHAADIGSLEVLVGLVVGCGLIVAALNTVKFLVHSYSALKTRGVKTVRGTWRRVIIWWTISTRRKERDPSKLQETELCIVCFSKARSVCLLPCRHLCLCPTCTQSLSYPLRCPLCRQRAEELIHVYL